MRLLLFLLSAAGIFAGCSNNDAGSALAGKSQQVASKVDTANFTTIQWIDSTKDFGKIEEGQKLEVSFRFKNTGDKPLIIERVQPSCGCTVAEQSKDPVAPGAEGLIKATFNSEGRSGINHKTLFVSANTKGSQTHSLQFQVEVEKKK
ncbi:MAG: DUF1573 domain-containing protein [Puia sp.]|nr:DUF1573 domain-containing protein [Puia sp.]